MVRVTCYIRPHRLEQVKTAIASLGISGMTVSDVRGTGNGVERTNWLGGDDALVWLPLQSRIEVVCTESLVDPIVESILENARTGEPGDGKIFLSKVDDAVRIRTLERGNEAV